MTRLTLAVVSVACLAVGAYPQERVTPAEQRTNIQANAPQKLGRAANNSRGGVLGDLSAGSSTVSADYVLGPGDLLTVSEAELGEVFTDKTYRVDGGGDVTIPFVGHLHAAGLTTMALQSQVNEGLAKILKEPDVVVGIAEFHSQPISVLGAVNNPGVHQLQGVRNLFEVLSLAGGLSPDAGNLIKITRRQQWGSIPLPDAKPDPSGQFSVASVKAKSIMAASNPAENITILPEDVVSVPKGEVVYAVGAVIKPGGFLLGENGALSTLQVISLSEGLLKTAAADKAEILRAVPGSSERKEIAINVKNLINGKASDVALQADDILFIPNSASKTLGYRSLDAIVQAATGIAIYGRY